MKVENNQTEITSAASIGESPSDRRTMLRNLALTSVGILAVDALSTETQAATTSSYPKVNAVDFGFSESNTGAANRTALLAAIDNSRHVIIPAGNYHIAGDIKIKYISQVIEGETPASAYNSSNAATSLIFTSGTVGFDLTTTFQEIGDSENSFIRNLKLDGNGIISTVIKFSGTKFFENLHLENFITNGFWGVDKLNSSIIDNCSIFNYNSRGAAWGSPSQFVGIGALFEGSQTTAYFIKNSRFRCCQYGIIVRAAQGCSFSDCVIESNSAVGIHIEAMDGNGTIRNIFQNCWLENNSADAGTLYQLSIRNYATTPTWYSRNNLFINCNFSTYPGQKAILIDSNVIETTFQNCFIGTGSSAGDSIACNSAPENNTRFISCEGIQSNYGLQSWNNYSVVLGGGSYLKKSPNARSVHSVGDSPSVFDIPAGQKLKIRTDASNYMSAMVHLYCANTGHGAVYFLTPFVFTEIIDTASTFQGSETPAINQIGIYADSNGCIYLKNNFGSIRNLSVSVVGARILSVYDPT